MLHKLKYTNLYKLSTMVKAMFLRLKTEVEDPLHSKIGHVLVSDCTVIKLFILGWL